MVICGPSFDNEAMKLSKPFHLYMKHFIYLLKNLTEKRNTAKFQNVPKSVTKKDKITTLLTLSTKQCKI